MTVQKLPIILSMSSAAVTVLQEEANVGMESSCGDIDKRSVLAATCFASSVGALLFNIMPIILGIFAETKGFDEETLAMLAAATLFGAFAAVTSAAFWISRFSWPPVMAGSAIAASLTALAMPGVDNPDSYAILLVLIGFFLGLILAPTLAALGQATDTARGFAIATIVQVVVASFLAYSLPAFILPAFSNWALPIVILTCCALILLSYRFLPVSRRPGQDSDVTSLSVAAIRPATSIGIAGLVVMGIFYGGVFGIWEFLERIGADRSLEPSFIGSVIAMALLLGGCGSLISAIVGERFGLVKPVIISALVLGSAVILLIVAPTPVRFAAAVLLFNIGWNMALPYLYTTIAEADPDGRLIVLAPAVQTLGSVFGSLAAGQLVLGLGFSGIYGLFLVLVSFAVLMHIFSARALRRKIYPAR